MRVLVLATTGDAAFLEDQVRSLRDHGVAVTVVAVGSKGDTSGDRHRRLRAYGSVLRRTMAAAAEPYDLVHVHYGLLAPLGLLQPRRPAVLTFWGSDLMSDSLVARMGRRAATHYDAVLLPSPAMSPYLETPHRVVPFGVDTELFRPIPRSDARRHLGWDPEETVVLFPNSRERAIKNYSRAARIVERLPTDATLRWVTGEPHEEMPYYMNASDAVLVTSRRESGPMVVKEAAACNVPVFATDVGFAGDVLGPVSNSGVCRSDEAFVRRLEAVLSTGARSDGREHVGPDLDAAAEALVTVYRSVLLEETPPDAVTTPA